MRFNLDPRNDFKLRIDPNFDENEPYRRALVRETYDPHLLQTIDNNKTTYYSLMNEFRNLYLGNDYKLSKNEFRNSVLQKNITLTDILHHALYDRGSFHTRNKTYKTLSALGLIRSGKLTAKGENIVVFKECFLYVKSQRSRGFSVFESPRETTERDPAERSAVGYAAYRTGHFFGGAGMVLATIGSGTLVLVLAMLTFALAMTGVGAPLAVGTYYAMIGMALVTGAAAMGVCSEYGKAFSYHPNSSHYNP